MAWILPLASIAVGLISKEQEKSRAGKAALDNQLLDIAETRAKELGASPYRAMTDRFMVNEAHRKAAENNVGSSLGTALQAYSAVSKAGGSGDKSFGGWGDERGAYESAKDAGVADSLSEVDNALGAFDRYQRDKSSDSGMFDDPWKRR